MESFSNLGLHFSRELLTVEPARRGTGHQTILKSSNKALKSNARTHPLHTSSLRKHPFLQTSPAAKGEVNVRNECFRRLSHIFFSDIDIDQTEPSTSFHPGERKTPSLVVQLLMSTESENLSSLRSKRQKGH